MTINTKKIIAGCYRVTRNDETFDLSKAPEVDDGWILTPLRTDGSPDWMGADWFNTKRAALASLR